MNKEHLKSAEDFRSELLSVLNEQIEAWAERKDNAPEPQCTDDYWWECKACWSIYREAKSLILEAEIKETKDDYSSQISKKLTGYNQWGSMENWGSEAQWQALRYLQSTLRKFLGDLSF